jgi:hypothetical protein
MALSMRDETFCQAYVTEKFIGTRAALKAGWPEASAGVRACETLKRFEIQERIGQILAARTEKSEDDTKLILDSLRETVRLSARKIPRTVKGKQMYDLDGEPVSIQADPKSLVKAAKLLGQYHAMWVERKEISGDLTLEQILEETDR